MSILSKPYFHDEAAAYAHLEGILWPEGVVCPHCGNTDKVYKLGGVKSKPSKKNPEGKERFGLKKCGSCRQQFTVTVGTVYESSHIPLHKWLQATYLMCSSKKGISASQIARTLEITYKSAWFVCHRIREAMTDKYFKAPLGGKDKIVEADETYVGGKEKNKHANKKARMGRGAVTKMPVVSLVERNGNVRSFHLPEVNANNLKNVLEYHVSRKSCVMTDEHTIYPPATEEFADHQTVNHSSHEYVRDGVWHTNTVENYFSLLKRGIVGTFHHVSQQHLNRYVAEFDFRYNSRTLDDTGRTMGALAGIQGKRLMYKN